MNQTSTLFFHPDVIKEIKESIVSHDYAEVFFVGWVDELNVVTECCAVAFGNDEMVPSPLGDALKGDLVIHNHPSGDLRASNADVTVASLLATKKMGFYIIDNHCSEVNVVYKPKPRISLSIKQLSSIFKNGGLLEEYLGYYEDRPEQEILVSKIAKTINQKQILLAEAGTGTGKSLSYLIPAALWATQSDRRIFVSTHTINLQNQLIQKDAELVSSIVEKVIGIRPRFALLVGKSNYLCLKYLEEIRLDRLRRDFLFEDSQNIRNQLDLIHIWAERTENGLRSEIPEKISSDLWEEISAATPNCPKKACSFYSDCFYYRARMLAESAHIIIGNHALLLATIDNEKGLSTVIPHFSGIVIDEAHNLFLSTLSAMAETFSFQSLTWRFSRLYRQKGDKVFGQLSLIRDRLNIDSKPELSEHLHLICQKILHTSEILKNKESEIFFLLSSQTETQMELSAELLKTDLWKKIRVSLDTIFFHIKEIELQITLFSEKIKNDISDEKILESLRVIDLQNEALHKIRKIFEQIFNPENEILEIIKQIELTKKTIAFMIGPIEVGDFLAKHIFRSKDFTIFTSATLTTEDTFNFFSESIGLPFVDQEKIQEIKLLSPFDYENQMSILVLDDKNEIGKEQRKLSLIKAAILNAQGGTLLLYTSYKAMDKAFSSLYRDLVSTNLLPLKQGDHPREYLIHKMQEKDFTVLFGTSSFWEGIDIQGNHLRLLIIDKLPFDNPSNPLTKAICRLMDSKNRNSFVEFSLPRAVLKYKQGIGRLIRSKKDEGILLVLDNRIFTKFYGQSFIKIALPCKSKFLNSEKIKTYVQEFFYS